jgi:hypothetical protein
MPLYIKTFTCEVNIDDEGVLYVSRHDGKTSEVLVCVECGHKTIIGKEYTITGSGTICLNIKKK